MFFSGIREINIKEYTCSSVQTKRVPIAIDTYSTVADKMKFSVIRLSIAMARTILSRNPLNRNLIFEALSSFYNMQSIVDENDNNIRLDNNIHTTFRDFSFTTRIGELAQALNYIFAQDILGYSEVVDFEGFLLNNGFVYTGKSPDFILSNTCSSSISFIESKGTCSQNTDYNLKGTLNKALDQCHIAKAYFSALPSFTVKNTYASVVWFSRVSDTLDTNIHFTDPEYNDITMGNGGISLMRYHYSSWFALLGYSEQVEELLKNLNITLKEPNKVVLIMGDEFYILNMKNRFISNYFLGETFVNNVSKYKKIEFCISKRVWNILKYGENKQTADENLHFEHYSNENIEIFVDGTAVMLK